MLKAFEKGFEGSVRACTHYLKNTRIGIPMAAIVQLVVMVNYNKIIGGKTPLILSQELIK